MFEALRRGIVSGREFLKKVRYPVCFLPCSPVGLRDRMKGAIRGRLK